MSSGDRAAHGQGLPDTPRWSVPSAAPAYGAPVLTGSAVVVQLRTGVLTAHRLSDGSVLWTRELTATQPLTSDDRHVYVASEDGLQALDGGTGEVAWYLRPPGPLTAPPFAHAGWVLAAAAGELLAIRASDGHVVWRKQLGAIEFRPGLDGDLLVVPLIEGRMVALDVRDGAQRWSSPLWSSPGEPLVIGGRVYVGTQNKWFYSLFSASGRIEWHKPLGAIVAGRAAVDERHVYFAALDNVIYALNRRTGTVRWRPGLPYRPSSGPVLVGTSVLVPSYVDIPLKAFDALTGAEVGAITFAATLTALPLFTRLDDGTPVVIGITGNLENKVMVTLLVPKLVPDIPLQPLTALPGEAVLLPEMPVLR